MPKKNWVFTIPNPDPEQDQPTNLEMFTYLVLGKEVGEGGLNHLQGFCVLKEPLKFAVLKVLFPRWRNIQNTRCSEETNAAYCKKGEQSHDEWEKFKLKGPNYGKNADVFEHGECPAYRKKGSEKGAESTKRKWDDAWTLAKSGDVESIDAKIRITNYRTIRQVQKDFQQRPEDLDGVCGVWYYGPPNTGKSYLARDLPSLTWYDKPCNKWWDGYQGEDVVIIDDFDLQHKVLGHHLKRWADRYSFPAEMKGSTLQIRPKKIVVTSNYPIQEIFNDDEELQKALLRRFKVTHFHEKEWWKKQSKDTSPPMKKPRYSHEVECVESSEEEDEERARDDELDSIIDNLIALHE